MRITFQIHLVIILAMLTAAVFTAWMFDPVDVWWYVFIALAGLTGVAWLVLMWKISRVAATMNKLEERYKTIKGIT